MERTGNERHSIPTTCVIHDPFTTPSAKQAPQWSPALGRRSSAVQSTRGNAFLLRNTIRAVFLPPPLHPIHPIHPKERNTMDVPTPRASSRPLSDADARLKQHVYGPSSLSSGQRRHGPVSGKGAGNNEHWRGRETGIGRDEVRWIAGLTVVAVAVRCWKIWQPTSVVYVASVLGSLRNWLTLLGSE